MVTLLVVTYISVIALAVAWTIVMFRSNRHFRSAIQHPSLTYHIRP
ncbi:MAG: hypothetical protein JW863_24010 [Chitinispirillaceae bacterium]|nr:hypothetical protein [Chitinispirillaceae bacterium]